MIVNSQLRIRLVGHRRRRLARVVLDFVGSAPASQLYLETTNVGLDIGLQKNKIEFKYLLSSARDGHLFFKIFKKVMKFNTP